MATVSTPSLDAVVGQIVDAMSSAPGVVPGHRPIHAKGFITSAVFTPTPRTAKLSRAAHFAGAPVPATVRFSNGSGDLRVHDGQPNVRGMSVKFHLPDGSATDIVSITVNGFVVSTAEEFFEFVKAQAPDPATGKPSPERMGAFLSTHPATQGFLERLMARAVPASYARVPYHAEHSFMLVARDGSERWIRYHWAPEAGEAYLPPQKASGYDADFLRQELENRLKGGPVTFRLNAQLAGGDDVIDDATVIWPDDREVVELGRLDINSISPTSDADERRLIFDPAKVTDGIRPSGDPLIPARSRAYAISFAKRTGNPLK